MAEPVMSYFRPAFDTDGVGGEFLDKYEQGLLVREALDKRKRREAGRKYLEENPSIRPEDMYEMGEALPTSETAPYRREEFTGGIDEAPTQDVKAGPYQHEALRERRVNRDAWDKHWQQRKQALLDTGDTDSASKIDLEKANAEFQLGVSVLSKYQRGINANDPLAMKQALDEIGELSPYFDQNVSQWAELGDDGKLYMGEQELTRDHFYALLANREEFRSLFLQQAELDSKRAGVEDTRADTAEKKSRTRLYNKQAELIDQQNANMSAGLGRDGTGGLGSSAGESTKARDEAARARESNLYTNALQTVANDYDIPVARLVDGAIAWQTGLINLTGDEDISAEQVAPHAIALESWRAGVAEDKAGFKLLKDDNGNETYFRVDEENGTLGWHLPGTGPMTVPIDSPVGLAILSTIEMRVAPPAGGDGGEGDSSGLWTAGTGLTGLPSPSWDDIFSGKFGRTIAPTLTDWMSRYVIEPGLTDFNSGAPKQSSGIFSSATPGGMVLPDQNLGPKSRSVGDAVREYSGDVARRSAEVDAAINKGKSAADRFLTEGIPESEEDRRKRLANEARRRRMERSR